VRSSYVWSQSRHVSVIVSAGGDVVLVHLVAGGGGCGGSWQAQAASWKVHHVEI